MFAFKSILCPSCSALHCVNPNGLRPLWPTSITFLEASGVAGACCFGTKQLPLTMCCLAFQLFLYEDVLVVNPLYKLLDMSLFSSLTHVQYNV